MPPCGHRDRESPTIWAQHKLGTQDPRRTSKRDTARLQPLVMGPGGKTVLCCVVLQQQLNINRFQSFLVRLEVFSAHLEVLLAQLRRISWHRRQAQFMG